VTLPLPVEQLRAAYAEWSASCGASSDPFIALMSEHAVVDSVLGRHSGDPLAQTFRGPDGAREFIAALTGPWEILDHETERMVAEGNTIVWIGTCRLRNRATGAELETPLVDIWRFDDEGKVSSFYEMCDSLAFAQASELR
jgi:uncharacterized protein